jgi:hypothetical protein
VRHIDPALQAVQSDVDLQDGQSQGARLKHDGLRRAQEFADIQRMVADIGADIVPG